MTGCKIGKVTPKMKVVKSFHFQNDHLINELEQALERAKKGDITSGVWVLISRQGSVYMNKSQTGGQNYLMLVGALEEAKCFLMDIEKS